MVVQMEAGNSMNCLRATTSEVWKGGLMLHMFMSCSIMCVTLLDARNLFVYLSAYDKFTFLTNWWLVMPHWWLGGTGGPSCLFRTIIHFLTNQIVYRLWSCHLIKLLHQVGTYTFKTEIQHITWQWDFFCEKLKLSYLETQSAVCT